MTVEELSLTNEFSVICMPDGKREIGDGYIGDLLSWVMGHAKADDAWITIMSNVNVAAVATLCDTACVILSEGVKPDDDLLCAAKDKGINLLSFNGGSYEAAKIISKLI